MRRGARRTLTTVLFTDIVGSTERAAEVGDGRWRELLAAYHGVVRRTLRRFGGRQVNRAGDGFLATFEQPVRAVECASAIATEAMQLGLGVRAGVHTGEVEWIGNDVGGIGVHIGARVAALGGPGEVMVSGTVRDMIAGSEVQFVDRGSHVLRGVPGEWRVFAAQRLPDRPVEPGPRPRQVPWARPWLSRQVIAPLAGLAALALVAGVLVFLFAPPRAAVVPGVNSLARFDPSSDVFTSAIGVGDRPTGITAGGGFLWVINAGSQTLSQIDPKTGQLIGAPVGIGSIPTQLAYGDGSVWITSEFNGIVRRFDPNRHDFKTISVKTGVAAIAVNPTDGSVWVTNKDDNTVTRIDPLTNTVLSPSVRVGDEPVAIAIGVGRVGGVWVANALGRSVSLIDPGQNAVLTTIPLPPESPPSAITVGDGAVWVASQAGLSVTRIDPATDQDADTFQVESGPAAIAVDAGRIWVSGHVGKQLVRIDIRPDGTRTGRVQRFVLRGDPDGIYAGQGVVWVTVRSP